MIGVLALAFGGQLHAQGLSSQWLALDVYSGTNNESEFYSPSQVTVSNGYLQLTAIDKATGGEPYTSGAVVWSTYNFLYGTVEYRAKMAGGQGPWPAIWMVGYQCQPPSATIYNAPTCNWPNPGSDEIDLTEILGSDHTEVNQQVHSATSNAGCDPSGISDVSQNYHVYDFTWTATELTWYIDGVKTCTVPGSAISATNKFLIINVAVGGNGGGTVNASTLPQSTSVDYVRVYANPSYPPIGTPVFDDEFNSSAGPAAPTGALATMTSGAATISWTASSGTDHAAGYTVLRGTASGGPYSALTSALDANTSYTDATVQSGHTYYYVVTATDSAGNVSGYSNQAVAAMPSPSATAVTSISLSPASIIGGKANSTATVTLNGAAPTGGALITLSSGNTGAATVPVSVTVASGATTTSFSVTTNTVSQTTTLSISATYNRTSQSATLTVNSVLVGSAVSFVRVAGSSKDEAGYTVAIKPAASDFLAVFVWSATTPTVTDNLGSSYSRDCTITYMQGIGMRQLTVYHLQNASSGITGISISSQPWSRAIVAEYSGMPISGAVLDFCGTAKTNTTASTSWSSTAATTTANDLVFGLADTGFTAAAGYKASGAWTGRLEQPDTADVDDGYLEDQINMAVGSYTATGTTTASVQESSVVVAFKTGH